MAENPEDLIVTDAELRRQLPALAKELKIGGSGVEQVSGTVTLDASGGPIREFFTTGSTTFKANGADTSVSSYTAVVWRRDGSGVWAYRVVDTWTATGPSTGGGTPPTPTTVTPPAPTRDDDANTYTIPTLGGVSYYVAGVEQTPGVHPWPGGDTDGSLTITAVAQPGYALTGTTSWTFTFKKKAVADGPYDAAALALNPEHYYRLDGPDAASEPNLGTASAPKLSNIGTFTVAPFAGFPGALTSGGAMLNPYPTVAPTAYTAASVFRFADAEAAKTFKPGVLGMNGARLDGASVVAWRLTTHSGKIANATGAGATPLEVGRIYHCAVTWDGTTVRGYLDGVEVASVADAAPVPTSGAFINNSMSVGGSRAGLVIDTKCATPAQVKALSDAVVRA